MKGAAQAVFPPFHLDPESQQLLRGSQAIPLRPKTFAVLWHLLVVEDLVARGSIVEVSGRWRLEEAVDDVARGVPESLRQLIESNVDRLAEAERCLLEAASVAGSEFSAAAVATALGLETERVEERCNALVRRGAFLGAAEAVTGPDRSSPVRYQFLHGLYLTVLYDRLPAARRARPHQRIGEAEEALRGHRAGEIAAQLAVHFERAQDHARAVRYLRHAAENALRRYALREAIAHLTELCRIEGELILQASAGRVTTSARRRAERRLREAVEVAHRQGAVSFELRAVTSLARLR